MELTVARLDYRGEFSDAGVASAGRFKTREAVRTRAIELRRSKLFDRRLGIGQRPLRDAQPSTSAGNRGENVPMHLSPLILDRIGRTPMVCLNRVAAGLRATVLGKCEFLNPGGSIKDRIALAIVEDAELPWTARARFDSRRGHGRQHRAGPRLVAAARGYRVVCVLPNRGGRGAPYMRPRCNRRGRASDGRGVVRCRSPVDPGGGAARRGIVGDDCRGGVATCGTRGLRRSRRRRSGRLMGPIPVPAMAPAQLTKKCSA